MTAKEEAKELVESFSFRIHIVNCFHDNKVNSKECALIAVDKIIKALKYPPKSNEHRQVVHIKTLKYWEEVKQEIQKL